MAYIELKIPVAGNRIPTHHGYGLFGAICRHIPEAHDSDWLAIDTLPGQPVGNGITVLDPKANLKIRVPQERVAMMLSLAGQQMNLGHFKIRLGTPQISLLRPSSSLYARIVTIKNYQENPLFLDAIHQKLDLLGVSAEVAIGVRRIVKVSTHTVVGFAVMLHGLTAESSLILQELGVGGRRHFGCGYLHPVSSLRLPDSEPGYFQQ